MEIFKKHHKIIDLVESNYHLLPVINRFGIALGNQDKSLEKICTEKDINVDFFLVILNTFNNEDYFPQEEMKSFSPLLIVDYLIKTHKYYLDIVIPKLDNLLGSLIRSDTSESKQLEIIEQFYLKYKEELFLHIQKEEQDTFPYIKEIVNQRLVDKDYNIHVFEKEHTNIDEKLNDLKNLIIKYIKPVYDHNICNDFIVTLFRFEKDLKDHARIEDKVLVPQIEELEKEING